MADELTRCPACDHTLRLPVELLGRPVECPKCGHRFTPSAEVGAGPMAMAPARGSDGLTAPAIALLVTSILTVLSNCGGVQFLVQLKQDPTEYEKALRQGLDNNPNMKPEERQQAEDILKMFSPENLLAWGTPYCGLSWLTTLLTLGGAIAMLTRKAYAFAVIGCLAAFFPSSCCIVQAPFGLWGLIVLLGSGKAAFR